MRKKFRAVVAVAFRRNPWRVLAFDIAAPLATVAALLLIGVVLRWPLWWVSACSMLVLLVVAAMAVNVVLARRRSVTVGTDDDGPRLRLAVVAVATAALAAAVGAEYTHWTAPDRQRTRDSAEVVQIGTAMAEAASTFSPQNPTASLDRATAMMAPARVNTFKDLYAKSTAGLAHNLVTAEAATISAGVEAITPSAASVAVIMRGTTSRPDAPSHFAVVTLRVKLSKTSGHWLVFDVAPIHR